MGLNGPPWGPMELSPMLGVTLSAGGSVPCATRISPECGGIVTEVTGVKVMCHSLMSPSDGTIPPPTPVTLT